MKPRLTLPTATTPQQLQSVLKSPNLSSPQQVASNREKVTQKTISSHFPYLKDYKSNSSANLPRIPDDPSDEEKNSKGTQPFDASRESSNFSVKFLRQTMKQKHSQKWQQQAQQSQQSQFTSEGNLPTTNSNSNIYSQKPSTQITRPTQTNTLPLNSFLDNNNSSVAVAVTSTMSSSSSTKGVYDSKKESIKMREKFSQILNSQQLIDEDDNPQYSQDQTASQYLGAPIAIAAGVQQALPSPIIMSSSNNSNMKSQIFFKDRAMQHQQNALGTTITERMQQSQPAAAEEIRRGSYEIPRSLQLQLKHTAIYPISKSSKSLATTNKNLGAMNSKSSMNLANVTNAGGNSNFRYNSLNPIDATSSTKSQKIDQFNNTLLSPAPTGGLFLSQKNNQFSTAQIISTLPVTARGNLPQNSNKNLSLSMTEFTPNNLLIQSNRNKWNHIHSTTLNNETQSVNSSEQLPYSKSIQHSRSQQVALKQSSQLHQLNTSSISNSNEAAAATFFTPRRQNTLDDEFQSVQEKQQRELKFKRVLNTEESVQAMLSTSTASIRGEMLNPNHTQNSISHSKYLSPEIATLMHKETPLLTTQESETNWKVKHSQSLNNLYLKMLDEFQIPYEQDFDKIRKKIVELSHSQEVVNSTANNSSSSISPSQITGLSNPSAGAIDKKFVLNLLQNQLDSQKIETQKYRQLRVPSNRYDVEVLKQWLDFMVFKVYSDSTNNENNERSSNTSGLEILEKLQSILESCFQEILKQVSQSTFTKTDTKTWINFV